MKSLIAVNYHHVIDPDRSNEKIPGNGISFALFKFQIDKLLKHYQPLLEEELINFFMGNNVDSKKEGLVLTFDDGLKCHHDVVAPILADLNIPAIFFVSSGPTVHSEILLVHQHSWH